MRRKFHFENDNHIDLAENESNSTSWNHDLSCVCEETFFSRSVYKYLSEMTIGIISENDFYVIFSPPLFQYINIMFTTNMSFQQNAFEPQCLCDAL